MQDKEERTFKTRLLFIKDLFSNLYDQADILANCINYKLRVSYEEYYKGIKFSSNMLSYEDPLKLLKKINKN